LLTPESLYFNIRGDFYFPGNDILILYD